MSIHLTFTVCFALFIVGSCSEAGISHAPPPVTIEQQVQKLSGKLTESEIHDDMESFLRYYNKDALCMPEYQPTLTGIHQIKTFYKEIFHRQNIKVFKRTVNEIIHLDSTIIEIGTFKKEYSEFKSDTIVTQNGKYWNIWNVGADGNSKLKGQAFGFFHPVVNPGALVVQMQRTQPIDSDISLDKSIPFELKAYNALMEKGVRIRDGALRAEFFTVDGSFMPIADSIVSGMDKMKPYLIAYSSRGQVTIDSISVYTYHAEYFDDYVLEYPMFRVKWTTPQLSGKAEGKGIRIWKRQQDKSLRIYREIGMHNHIE